MVDADRKTIEDAPLLDLDKLKAGDPESLNIMFNYYGIEEFRKQTSEEEETYDQNYRAGEDLGERRPSNEGSYQITQDYPDQHESNTRQEANFDKMKGIKNSEDTQ
jgi:hypothetical protein